jgi:hypothetical protein
MMEFAALRWFATTLVKVFKKHANRIVYVALGVVSMRA